MATSSPVSLRPGSLITPHGLLLCPVATDWQGWPSADGLGLCCTAGQTGFSEQTEVPRCPLPRLLRPSAWPGLLGQ